MRLPNRSELLAVTRRRLPIVGWLPRYSSADAVADLVAGITVGLTLIPQAIAYSALAGLSPQYGLYSAFAGSFVYIVFGTTPEVNIGPTALLSLLTFSYTSTAGPDAAVLLCFLAGCVEFLCGVMRLGFLVEFVSGPVVAGFTSAAAIIIASSQLKGLLGIKYRSESFIGTWTMLVENIGNTNLGDLALSAGCITVLLSTRKLKDLKVKGSLGRLLWLVSTGRNALVVVISASIAYYLSTLGPVPFKLTGQIESGLPPVGLPPFTIEFKNSTHSFTEMCKHLGGGLAVIPIVSILGNIAIAKAFSQGKPVDATQEMATLGLCNIAGSFFRSMPVTGSFSRSAVNNASGVRTPLGGLYTGVMVLLALSLLTPYFYFIPRATLSSVIICAVIFMVEVRMTGSIWKANRRDLVPALVTFFACLGTGVELGILIGIIVDLAFLLYYNARPKVQIEKVMYPVEYIHITMAAGLLFPAVGFVLEEITNASNKISQQWPIVINCKHVPLIDYTAAQGVQTVTRDFAKVGRQIVFHNVQQQVAEVLDKMGTPKCVYSTNELELDQILKGESSISIPITNGKTTPSQQYHQTQM